MEISLWHSRYGDATTTPQVWGLARWVWRNKINSTQHNRQVKKQLASQVSKNTLHNFDRIVIVTHWTSPIKVGATVGTAFLHISPDDESHMEALLFKSWKSRETDVEKEKSEIKTLLDLIRFLSFGFTRWTSVLTVRLVPKPNAHKPIKTPTTRT